jgi:hypothetical protein
MRITGQGRAVLIASLWIALVLALLAGVSTGPIAILWNAVLVGTSIFTGLWAAEWYKWRSRGGHRR